jgi:two-component system, NarL family, sensor histidine kinase UhpB
MGRSVGFSVEHAPVPGIRGPTAKQRGFHAGGMVILALVSLALLTGLFFAKLALVESIAELAPIVDSAVDFEDSVHDFSSAMLAMQGARRGFALTGDRLFIEAFDKARGALHERRARLNVLAARLPRQFADVATDLPRLLMLGAEYESQLHAALQARVQRPHDTAEQERFTNAGEPLSRGIVEIVLRMDRTMETRLQAKLTELAANSQRAEKTEAGLFAAGVFSAAVGFVLAAMEMRRRKEALRMLDDANAGLERKVAQRTAELERTQARWRSLVELSNDAIVACGPQRVAEYLNPAALSLVQRAGVTEPQGKTIDALFAGPGNAVVGQELARLCEQPGRATDLPGVLSLPDGAQLPVQVSAVSYREGAEIRGQIVIRDVSAQRTQERALFEHIDFIEQLFEAIPLPLSLRDAQGRVLRVNRAVEALRGERRNLIGKTVFEYLPEPLARQVAGIDARAMRTSQAIESDFSTQDPQGRPTFFRAVTQAVRRSDGSLIGVLTVSTDVTAMHAKEVELEALNADLRQMSVRLIGAQEEERRRVSRELHDQVGQVLTALKIRLGLLAAHIPGDVQPLAQVRELADEALRQTRDLTASMHPHLLADLGLAPALRWLVENLVRPSGVEVDLRCELCPERGTKEIELVAFRIVQESLTNVVRHAHARSAWVALHGGEGRLSVEVRDDGQGSSQFGAWLDTDGKPSVGVAGMRDRVREAGGEFDIQSTPGEGTVVRAVLTW